MVSIRERSELSLKLGAARMRLWAARHVVETVISSSRTSAERFSMFLVLSARSSSSSLLRSSAVYSSRMSFRSSGFESRQRRSRAKTLSAVLVVE
jgi:hypothetical protein